MSAPAPARSTARAAGAPATRERPAVRRPVMARVPASKRLMDVGLAGLALTLGAPLLLLAALLVRLTSRGPILFRQTRVGLGERRFIMLKLRTMRDGSDSSAYEAFNRRELEGLEPAGRHGLFRLEHDPRITPVGRVLRRLSIDELPQLLNVLRGEMSLVGPRPSLPFEVELYTAAQRRRHQCLPGMTGLWQVSGRNRLDMRRMLDLDLDYVARQSLLLDLRILLQTPGAILRGDGAG